MDALKHAFVLAIWCAGAYTLVGLIGTIVIGIWRYFTDRSGNSGRSGKHWSDDR
jgi:hypothetical protein